MKKYAAIGPKGGILRLFEKQPANIMDGSTIVELSEQQVSLVEDGFTSIPRMIYFYKEGEIFSLQQWRELQGVSRPKPPITAERHIEREGFPAIRLVSLMDLEFKLAQAGKTAAKLTAVRSWLDGVMATFAANPEPRNDWPKAPYGFEETVQEAASKL